jgi:hypothetical protein
MASQPRNELEPLLLLFYRLSPLACSYSESNSENMSPFRYFGRTPWMVDWLIARPLPTKTAQHKRTQTYICA